MTSKKQLKARIRTRMARTGERYLTARRHVLGAADPAQPISDGGWLLRGGVHPDSAALANVLAHPRVTAGRAPLSAAPGLVRGAHGEPTGSGSMQTDRCCRPPGVGGRRATSIDRRACPARSADHPDTGGTVVSDNGRPRASYRSEPVRCSGPTFAADCRAWSPAAPAGVWCHPTGADGPWPARTPVSGCDPASDATSAICLHPRR